MRNDRVSDRQQTSEPSFWLTLHYPHPSDPKQDVPWHVFLLKEHEDKAKALRRGDKVAFYETGEPDPAEPKKRGRAAVVFVGEVAESYRSNRAPRRIRNIEGSLSDFAWEVPCGRHETGTPVKFKVLTEILNRPVIRPPGGLMEITFAQFNSLPRLIRRLERFLI